MGLFNKKMYYAEDGEKKYNLIKTFTYQYGEVAWNGFRKDSNGIDYRSHSVEVLHGKGNSPAEALIDLAQRFEEVAAHARLAAKSARITYDKMHIEAIPELTAGPASSKDNLKHNQFMIESINNEGEVVVQ